MSLLPIVSHRDPGAAVALRGAVVRTAADFAADVARVAASLPDRPCFVNFCVDRYRFAVGLAAGLLRNQVSLLPPSQTPEMLGQLEREYGALYALTDVPQASSSIEQVAFGPECSHAVATPMPAVPADRIAAIAFTSGSTGRPTAHRKSWGALVRGAKAEARTFGLHEAPQAAIVATVPPQHMYGLESSVLMAMQNALALHAGRPFYPADVAAALADVPGERVLVTTPVHLRALVEEQVDLPPLRLIVCATAPLSVDLAARAEQQFGAPLHEVYGFTEAGMVATRRTTRGPLWHCLPDVGISERDGTVRVAGGHVEVEVPFTDVVEVQDPSGFILHGRSADMVNIAGKRTSLAYLNHQLTSIEGVRDGVFFMPEDAAGSVTRPLAFAVAPGLSREALLQALRTRIDDVFLPRPLHLVDALPRNATGKLQREALARLARTQPAASAGTGSAITVVRQLAADHPAAPGHFPGNPLMPGVVLLDEVIAAAREHGRIEGAACTIRSAKFLRPVRPGETIAIVLEPQAEGSVRFTCRVGGETAATGSLQGGGSLQDAGSFQNTGSVQNPAAP